MGDRSLQVLVIDDSAFIRRMLKRMITETPGLELAGSAPNGRAGVEMALELKPDLITLDIEMPELNGLEALAQIQAKCPNPKPRVLMCSSLTSKGSREALEAMSLGAADVICKDVEAFGSDPERMKAEIVGKLLAIGASRAFAASLATARNEPAAGGAPVFPRALASHASPPKPAPAPVGPPTPTRPSRAGEVRALLIGSSTGGPPALEAVLRALPANTPFPIVVAQHMPPMFTKSIADRLDGLCAIRVIHGEGKATLSPGTAVIIEGGKHGHLRPGANGGITLDVTPDPPGYMYKPSVDALFSSAARVVGGACVGVVLTGMGEDGAVGAGDLKRVGATIFTQDAATSVVYGMPRAVYDAGYSDASLPPEQIGARLASLINGLARVA